MKNSKKKLPFKKFQVAKLNSPFDIKGGDNDDDQTTTVITITTIKTILDSKGCPPPPSNEDIEVI